MVVFFLFFDVDKWCKIISNLISNVLKFIGIGGMIKFFFYFENKVD